MGTLLQQFSYHHNDLPPKYWGCCCDAVSRTNCEEKLYGVGCVNMTSSSSVNSNPILWLIYVSWEHNFVDNRFFSAFFSILILSEWASWSRSIVIKRNANWKKKNNLFNYVYFQNVLPSNRRLQTDKKDNNNMFNNWELTGLATDIWHAMLY